MFGMEAYPVFEGDGSVDVCVNIENGALLERPVVVTITTSSSSATQNTDFLFTDTVLSFGSDLAEQCASVMLIVDSIVEDTEEIVLNAISSDRAVRIQTPSVNVVISDETVLRVMFQGDGHEVTEGAEVVICVELIDPIARNVQLILDLPNDDGKLHTLINKYVLIGIIDTGVLEAFQNVLMFTPGAQTSGCFTLEPVDDQDIENPFILTLGISSADVEIDLLGTVSLTVNDNDRKIRLHHN